MAQSPATTTTTTTTTTMTNTITTTSTSAHPHQPPRPKKNHQHQHIRIRTTTSPATAPAIVALGAQTFTETFGHSVTPAELQAYLDEAYTLDAITADLADPLKTTIVATVPRSSSPAAPASYSIVAAAGVGGGGDERGTGEDEEEEEEEEEVLLGFTLLTRDSNAHEPCVAHLDPAASIELQRLYVAASAQDMGVGSLLMRVAEDVARAEGRRDVWLGVWEENWTAQKAYARWGYGRVGEHDFVVGGVVQTDWILAKRLEG